MKDVNTAVQELMQTFNQYVQSEDFSEIIRAGKFVASGVFSFKTVPDERALQLIITVSTFGTPEELGWKAKRSLKKIIHAVDDQSIGRMFDHSGCAMVFDEAKLRLQMVWSCPVDDMTNEVFTQNVQRVFQTAAAWQSRWLPRILNIVQEGDLPPTLPVTLESENLFKK